MIKRIICLACLVLGLAIVILICNPIGKKGVLMKYGQCYKNEDIEGILDLYMEDYREIHRDIYEFKFEYSGYDNIEEIKLIKIEKISDAEWEDVKSETSGEEREMKERVTEVYRGIFEYKVRYDETDKIYVHEMGPKVGKIDGKWYIIRYN